MSGYTATVTWERNGANFLDRRYSRRHVVDLDGGLSIPASASPGIVPEPMSDPAALDPEEAFVASLASCHLLWFLAVAAERGFRVDSYSDSAVGTLECNAAGRLAITSVGLRPRALFSGDARPSREQIVEMHEVAHERCFIASSVKTDVQCEPEFADEPG